MRSCPVICPLPTCAAASIRSLCSLLCLNRNYAIRLDALGASRNRSKASLSTCRRMAKSRMAAVFQAWHCRAAHAGDLQQRARRLQTELQRRKLARVMWLWRGHAQDKFSSRVAADNKWALAQRRSLRRVLHAWHAHACDLASRRAAAVEQGKAVCRHLNQEQALTCFQVRHQSESSSTTF